jgi:inosine-uridine nucleoside N-ribohydrolase
MRDAKKRNALKVLNFGRDDHLQVLAGASNGLARDAQALFQDPSPGRMSAQRIEGVEVQQATFEIRVSQPATQKES